MNATLALSLVVAVLTGAYGLLHVLGQRFGWSAELRRKSVHIVLGLVCLSFPWLFREAWPVVLLGAIAFVALALLRLLPKTGNSLGADLHSVDRFSLGELFFPAVIVWTFLNSRDNLVLYVAPVAILTLADAGGALLGVRYGRNRFFTCGSGKSIEGSLTFFLIATLCTLLPLLLLSDLPFLNVLLISSILAGLATLVEGFSSRGYDNLLLPIACLLLLQRLLDLAPDALTLRLGVLTALAAILCLLRRATSLDGGGLLSAILFGYACHTLGNLRFLAIAFVFYLLHLAATCRVKQVRPVEHRIDAVLATTSTGLLWLTLHHFQSLQTDTALLCFTLGMAAHLAMMHCGTSFYIGKARPGYLIALAKGGLFIAFGFGAATILRDPAIPLPVWHDPRGLPVQLVLTTVLLLPIIILFTRWRGTTRDARTSQHLKQAILALPYSALGLLIHFHQPP